jgi:hypothetical protein
MPEHFTEATLYAKNLSVVQAAYFCGVFNEGQMTRWQTTRQPITEWAIYSKFVKPQRIHRDARRRILANPKDVPTTARVHVFVVCVHTAESIEARRTTLCYSEALDLRQSLLEADPASKPFICGISRSVGVHKEYSPNLGEPLATEGGAL